MNIYILELTIALLAVIKGGSIARLMQSFGAV
jgi:hypothetical protein